MRISATCNISVNIVVCNISVNTERHRRSLRSIRSALGTWLSLAVVCQRSNRVAQASQFVNVLLATSKLSSPLAVSHQWPVLVKSLATTGRSISSLHCHHGITASWHCHLFISRHHGIMAFMASCLRSSTCRSKRKPNGTSALFFMAAPRV